MALTQKSSELESLLANRELLKSKLVRITLFVRKFNEADDTNELVTRRDFLTKCLTRFEDIQTQLAYIETHDINEIDNETEQFNRQYCNTIARINVLLNNSKESVKKIEQATIINRNNTNHIKLLSLKLPTFSDL